MKRVKLIFILSCFSFAAYAQQIDIEFDREFNDNRKYFSDIGFEYGLFSTGGTPPPLSGNIWSLTGSYFYNDKFGFRSGISHISDLKGSNYYLKIPVLFSFRTKTEQGGFIEFGANESFAAFLFRCFLMILPKRFEFNIGPSLGYISPNDHCKYIWHDGNLVPAEYNNVSMRFASSLDANARLSFQFWRVCVNGNLGVSYLFTRNYQHHTYRYYLSYISEENSRPSWFANLTIGASFRF